MDRNFIRIEQIEIQNLKNVAYGNLDFGDISKGASVLGVYGQNGSGKTALIDALGILKTILSGRPLRNETADIINVGAKFAQLKFSFFLINRKTDRKYHLDYSVTLKKETIDRLGNMNISADSETETRVQLTDEILTCSGYAFQRRIKIADTCGDHLLSPTVRAKVLFGTDTEVLKEMEFVKRLTRTESRSFLFSKEFRQTVHDHCEDETLRFLFEALVYFGNAGLFVLNTANSGLISLNALPLMFRMKSPHRLLTGNVMIPIDRAHIIPEDMLGTVQPVMETMNSVLEKIVPGLTIGIKELGSQLMKDGTRGVNVQLFSYKNKSEIPLKYESEGIKKIISVLHLLISMYHSDAVTVAIDELDAGIFEYLLGELLKIIADHGRGQLIFTSHNLRPLETLDRRCIAFTTTNPQNRYVRMQHVKNSNNLRDFYFRDILLGTQDETLYEMTSDNAIVCAFENAEDDDENE